MSPVQSDPVQYVLSQNRSKGYAAVDLLMQSISLCVGLWYLPDNTIRRLSEHPPIRQEDFEREVCDYLKAKDPCAGTAFREFSQVRLLADTFQELFLYWAGFSNDKNQLTRLTELLINPYLSRVFRSELAVPAWLNRFAIALLPDENGVFYDGTAGAGGIALRVAQHGLRERLSLQIITNEIDPLLFHLSVLRSRIQGFEFQQTNKDCLSFPSGFLEADLSIMFPPLRGGESYSISDSLSCGSDWSYAYHQLNMLSANGVGICRIPNGALFNAKNRDFRKYLLQLNVLDMIIALPRNSVPASAAATSLVVFRKGRKRNDAVQIMELSSPILLKPGEDICIASYVQKHGILISPSQLDSSNLSPQRYLHTSQSTDEIQESLFNQNAGSDQIDTCFDICLKDAAQIYRGINLAGLSRHAGGAEVLRLSDVQNGRICTDNIVRYDLSTRGWLGKYQIHAGDILISCKGKAVKLCIVPEDMPLLLSHDFLGIRPDRAKIDSWYLFYFLQSPFGRQAIERIQMGSSITMIRAADLECLPVHYIPLAQQTQYAVELHSANALIDEQLAALNASKQRAYAQFYQKIGLEDFL